MTDATQDPTVSEFLSEAEPRLAEMAEAVSDLRRHSAARRALAMAAKVIRDRAALLGFRTIAGQAEWILVRAEDGAHEVRLALLEEAVDVLRRRIAALPGASARGVVAERAAGPAAQESP